jgi:integral membrane protein
MSLSKAPSPCCIDIATPYSMRKSILFQGPLRRFLSIGYAEGLSYIVLLTIAMPLKYYAGLPMAVKITGMLHGILFILYIAALAHAAYVLHWGIKKVLIAFVASLLPFATFFLHKFLEEPAPRGV